MTGSSPVQRQQGADEGYRALFPRLRVGRRWLNLLWTVPAAALVLLAGVTAAMLLRQLPAVQQFITAYPGSTSQVTAQGFPWWLCWQHFLNVLFLIPIMRSGLQILAGRPRLYWRAKASPGTEWLRIQRPVTVIPHWSAREDPVRLPSLVGLPGGRYSSGLARWWHLGVNVLWLSNGVIFYVLLFTTGQWTRIVPTSWGVFPDALSTLIQYLSLDFPRTNTWLAYNGLQLLAYFATVFVAAPLAVVTGLLQSPRLAQGLQRTRVANIEVVRSVHALTIAWFVLFVVVHITLVFATGALTNLNHIMLGRSGGSWAGVFVFAASALILGAGWVAATPVTIRHPKEVQRASQTLLGPLRKFF